MIHIKSAWEASFAKLLATLKAGLDARTARIAASLKATLDASRTRLLDDIKARLAAIDASHSALLDKIRSRLDGQATQAHFRMEAHPAPIRMTPTNTRCLCAEPASAASSAMSFAS